jgi:Flp pilus assembly pilin Flp
MITFIKDESGATAIEYGMLTGFAFGLIVTVYGTAFYSMSNAYNFIATTLSLA